MPEQNYENHVRQVPALAAWGLVVFATMIGAGVNLYESLGNHQRLYSAALLLVLSTCLLIAVVMCRTYALKAQDRAIRAEENFRHYLLTGKTLDGRLQPLQIVALRFASDAEFPDLARRAAEQNIKPDDIKRAIKNWRPDTYRA